MSSFGNAMHTCLATIVALVTALFFGAAPARAALGDEVTNIAVLTYESEGVTFDNISTNAAVFTIEARQTPSDVTFYHVVNADPGARQVQINGSDYSTDGQGGAFSPVPVGRGINGAAYDFSEPANLTEADNYVTGELIVVGVVDAGYNSERQVIETITVVVTTDTNDEITLRLYESGPDTGEFFGYVPSGSDDMRTDDPLLHTPRDTQLTATYTDRFNEDEVSTDVAFVDPYGRVFDSVTGELLNGVEVEIVNAVTGEPAMVFGVDGVSRYPSKITTGSTVSDEAGNTYELAQGEFLFPLTPAGQYRVQIVPPERYTFASTHGPEEFTDLANQPFNVIPGSYGRMFEVRSAAPLNFDVPLDPNAQLLINKTASKESAAIGDYISYRILVENRDTIPAPLNIVDTLPKGFRYVPRSVRAEGLRTQEPEIGPDGRTLVFTGAPILAGDAVEYSYVAAIGPGAPRGEAVNRVIASNDQGEVISNRGEAAVEITEDLFRSTLTIIGQVAEDACDGDEEWARELKDGQGVEGVRIYMEDGRYVTTDQDGLFHFEGVRRGAHVVQMDVETLPQGYEPMKCEENTRYAGSSISKFVDASGGTIWRANFYLKRTGEAAEEVVEKSFDDNTEYKEYGPAWLNAQTGEPEWVYPDAGRTPSSKSVNIGIKHGPKQTVELKLNGSPASALNYEGQDKSDDELVKMSRWRGLGILDGRNDFVAVVRNADGSVAREIKRTLWFVSEVERATFVDDQSELIADGRTKPVIAIRMEDGAGRAVHAGRIVALSVAEPYRLATDDLFEAEQALTVAVSALGGVTVGNDGIARVELEPTLQTGKVRLEVELENGKTTEIDAYLRPEKRDWIIVGLATAGAGYEGAGSGELKPVADDRVALFAKGMIKGDWLLTLAVDTAKRRGVSDESLFDRIDPQAYYTLYGDRTYQYSEAESRYPVFVKLEKETAQLLFGDYDTDLTDTELGRYSRRLSGLRAVYEGEKVSVTGFAAETNQNFVKDELAADGTSGPFVLTQAPMVRNSEFISVETRNRFRPDEVLSRQLLSRYVDYDIDFTTGEIFFRQPINTVDENFNPNIIIVDYETATTADRDIIAGGRAAIRPFADDRLEAGVTLIREEGGDANTDRVGSLAAVDLTAKVSDHTEIRAELAQSETDSSDDIEDRDGSAYLAEVLHTRERLQLRGYIREDEDGFGVGQQTSATAGIRRLGAEGEAVLSETLTEDDRRLTNSFEGQAYSETLLGSGAKRSVVEGLVRRDAEAFGASLGLRGVKEDFNDEERSSVLLTSSIRRTFARRGLSFIANHEQPLTQEGDESSLFPQRTIIGVDKTLTGRATLNLRHEMTNGANASGDITTAGVTVSPWTGGEARAEIDQVTQDSARRLGATVGVDQTFQVNERWTASLGAAHRARIDGGDDVRDVTPDAPISPFDGASRGVLGADEKYTSAYLGAGYRARSTTGAARIENRNSSLGDRWVFTTGAAREATEDLSLALAARVQDEALVSAADRRLAEVRLGTAWRPRGVNPVFFNRLDIAHEEVQGTLDERRFVYNSAINALVGDRTQVSGFGGVKFVKSTFNAGETEVSGYTGLIGGEVRYDVTPRFDLGFTASALHNKATNTTEYAYGPSVGVSPAKNVWVSLGYNVDGFTDKDFEAAEYSKRGLYLKFRMKFDQNTLDGFLDKISPEAR